MSPSAQRIATRDGAELTVRPIEPEDKAALVAAFEHLSTDSRYRRFLTPIRQLTESSLAYLTELDHRDHEALVAVTGAGEIVGVARYVRVRDRPEAAEVAVTVADDWQGRGVGTELLGRLAGRAEAAGVRSFIGYCLATNAEMLQLLDELGPPVRVSRDEPGLVELEVALPEAIEADAASPILRAVARAT